MTAGRHRGVILVGPRGAGKSTLAGALAKHLHYTRRDTDELIAAEVGCPAGEFLATVGEDAFRALEARLAVAALATTDRCVVALGGGAVVSVEIRAALARSGGFVVFLFAPLPVLLRRFARGPRRPPLTDLPAAEEVAKLWRERLPLYRAVRHLELDTFSANVTACVQSIAATIGPSGG